MIKDLVSLSGRRILVTGASSGIGRACACMASDLGAAVVVTGRRRDALEKTRDMMSGRDHHLVLHGDLTDAAFVETLVRESGKIDGLVHAAGVGMPNPVGLQSTEHVEMHLRTNFVTFLSLMRYYAKSRFRGEGLSVVAVSSIAAECGWSGVSAYSGSKGALSASVRALAVELAPKGIRVNSVEPSNIRTPMFERGAAALNDERSMQGLLARQPLGLGAPEQVAAPVCFLLSDAASFITGVNLPVDGGYSAQ